MWVCYLYMKKNTGKRKILLYFLFRSHMNTVRTTWSIRRSQIVFAVFKITQKVTMTLANKLYEVVPLAKGLCLWSPTTPLPHPPLTSPHSYWGTIFFKIFMNSVSTYPISMLLLAGMWYTYGQKPKKCLIWIAI